MRASDNDRRLDHALALDLEPTELALYAVLLEQGNDSFIAANDRLSRLVGSRRNDKQRGARLTIANAAATLLAAGLVTRERVANRDSGAPDGPGTPYRYWLRMPESDAPLPAWPDARAAVRALVGHLPEIGSVAFAVGARLAYACSAAGRLELTRAELAEVTARDPKTAVKHLATLATIEAVTSSAIGGVHPLRFAIALAVPGDVAPESAASVTSTTDSGSRVVLWDGAAPLVEQAIGRQERGLRAGTHLSRAQRREHFWEPALALQETLEQAAVGGKRELLSYAIKATLDKLPAPTVETFARYSQAVLRNEIRRRTRKAGFETNGDRAERESPEVLQQEVRTRLQLTQVPVQFGDRSEEAINEVRRLFREHFPSAYLTRIAETFFDSDRNRAASMLTLAIKYGSTDFLSVEPEHSFIGIDFLPNWQWPADLPPNREWQAALYDDSDEVPPWDEPDVDARPEPQLDERKQRAAQALLA